VKVFVAEASVRNCNQFQAAGTRDVLAKVQQYVIISAENRYDFVINYSAVALPKFMRRSV
jgi:hypothetical protein